MDNERADEIRRLEEDCQHWANDYAELAKLAEARRVVISAEIAARESAEQRWLEYTAMGQEPVDDLREWKGFLKDGEKPLDRLKREIADCRQLMKLYGEEKGRREIAEKLIEERAKSHVKTTEEWESEIEHYRLMFSRIAKQEVPRVTTSRFRVDGVSSKHDMCAHHKAMWEDCADCVSEFAKKVLYGYPATRVERDGAWFVPLRRAEADETGSGYCLSQLKDDEILVSPGWIYKRDVALVEMNGELP
jgi:hypothetical protein